MTNRKPARWNSSNILDVVHASHAGLFKAIVALYECQTADEKAEHSTKHANGRGFDASDAATGTRLAQWIMANPRRVANQDFRIACMILTTKYAEQLAQIANAKEAEKATALGAERGSKIAPLFLLTVRSGKHKVSSP